MSALIHPTALIDPTAKLGEACEVGPGCVVGAGVELGAHTRLLAHCVVWGPTTIGARNVLHPFSVLGGSPQDRGYRGEATHLTIGDDNEIREHVTMHRGTAKGRGTTSVGSHCMFMAGTHVAHDAVVGDGVVLANGTLLGGHVQLADWVVSGGQVAIAPFVRVGESAFLAGAAKVERDVPPFTIAAGDRARVRALNRVGLQRRGVPAESQAALKRAFKALFLGSEARAVALSQFDQELAKDPFVARLLSFLRDSK